MHVIVAPKAAFTASEMIMSKYDMKRDEFKREKKKCVGT
jgi:hypothetical protein